MPALSLNPGFVCILAALLALALPRGARTPLMVGAAISALWLMFDREFGAATAAAQMGLPVVLLNLDALNQIFGVAMLIALIVLGIASGARRSRSEDAAILLLCGGAVSALFVGDLVSFVAATSLAGLAAGWIVFSSPSPGAARSGVRLLIWHGVEGLLFLVGVAFQLSAGAGSSIFAHLNTLSIGGGFIFAALLIRAGAPLAHVWFKDAIAESSPVGAGAIASFSTMLGIYALARLYPSEPALIYIGLALMVVSAAYAVAEDDFRRAAASGQLVCTGVCLLLVGVGSPLALAAAEAHAFTTMFAFLALQLCFGAVFGRMGEARASSFAGLVRAMPITSLLLAFAGLAAAALPGLAAFVTTMLSLEAVVQWRLLAGWIAISAAPAVIFVGLMMRPALLAFRTEQKTTSAFREAPFPMLLAIGLAEFFCVSVGVAPNWLFGLLPADLAFQPYALDRVAPQLELLGGAGVVFLLLRLVRVAPPEQSIRLLDVDAFYRGPAANAGRWLGVVALRVYGAGRDLSEHAGASVLRRLSDLASQCDRPYRAGLAQAGQMAALLAVLAAALVFRLF